MQNQPILRRKHFIFDFPVEGTARINVSESGKLREAGARIGSLVLASFKKKNPIDALLLYGYIGVGKTDLLSGIVHSFDGSNDIPDEQPASKTYERYNCWPAVHKVNLRRGISRFNASFKPRSNEMLIVEWPEAFAGKDTEAFMQYKTNDILVHKNAIPDPIKKKLGIK